MKRHYRGGVINDPYFNYKARKGARPGERCIVYGPIRCGNKRYAVAIYFPNRKYLKKLIGDVRFIIPNLIIPGFYLRASSYSDMAQGMLVLDDEARDVPYNEEMFRQLAVIAKVWLDIYITPFFPPRIVRLYEFTSKFNERIVEVCKNRKYPSHPSPLERVYFDQLKRADEQVTTSWEIMKVYIPTVSSISKFFVETSDNPSDSNVRHLKSLATRLKSQAQKMAEWCEDRARTWPDFVDAATMYRELQETTRSPIIRYTPWAIFAGFTGLIINALSDGSITSTAAFTVAADLGVSFMRDLVLKPKWQAKSLRKSAESYRLLESRIARFLERYDSLLTDGFVRAA